MDGNIFENAPRVDANLYENDKKRCVFKKYPDTCGRGLSVIVVGGQGGCNLIFLFLTQLLRLGFKLKFETLF